MRFGNELTLPEVPTPTDNPPAGQRKVYFKSDGALYQKNSAGAEAPIGAAGAPIGAIFQWPAAAAPTGYALCQGQAISRTTYADLFAVLSTTWGSGDGSSTFNLPNLKGKIPVGLDAAQTEFASLTQTGGEKAHQITTSEMPGHTHTINHDHPNTATTSDSHNHTIPNHAHVVGFRAVATSENTGSSDKVTDMYNARGNGANTNSATMASNGGGGATSTDAHSHTVDIPLFSGSSGAAGGATGLGDAHQNLQPYVVMNYIIKIQ